MKTTNPQQDLEQALQQTEAELALAKQCLAQFTRGVYHELESPIKTLNNLIELFEEDYRHKLDKEGAELFTMIQTSARRSVTMVDGIVRYSRRSRLSGDAEVVEVRDAVDAALVELADVVSQYKAIIDVGPLPAVTTYRSALQQVLYELIDNSLRFTSPGNKQAQLSITGHRREQGVEIIVSDEGLGVEAQKDKDIFDAFTRLNAPKDHEGAGLGLPICLQLVSSMHGRLWVNTKRASGAAFHVYLPDRED